MRLFEEAPKSPKWPMAPSDFRDYRNELSSFDNIAAYVRGDLQLGDANQPEQLKGMQVTRGFFKLLGHPPQRGRDIEEQDEIEGSPDVAVLSHSLWMRRFDGDPNVIGKTQTFSGRPFQIVGVLPPGFQHVGGTFRTYPLALLQHRRPDQERRQHEASGTGSGHDQPERQPTLPDAEQPVEAAGGPAEERDRRNRTDDAHRAGVSRDGDVAARMRERRGAAPRTGGP